MSLWPFVLLAAWLRRRRNHSPAMKDRIAPIALGLTALSLLAALSVPQAHFVEPETDQLAPDFAFILEDVALAERVKKEGFRIYLAPAEGVARIRMYRRFGDMWEGWSKNLYLLFGSRPSALLRILAAPLLLWLGILFGWYAGSVLGIVGGLAAVHLVYMGVARWGGYPASRAQYLLPGIHLFAALMLSSWIQHRVRKQVVWKGRSYKVTGSNR